MNFSRFSLYQTFIFLETLLEYKHEDDMETFHLNLLPTSAQVQSTTDLPFNDCDSHFAIPRMVLSLQLSKERILKDFEENFIIPKHVKEWTC